MINDAVKQQALAHAQRTDPCEACGLVVLERRRLRYVPADNIASDPTNTFIIDPTAIRAAEETGDIVGIVHSHVTESVDPSPADRVACDANGIPWYIVQARQGLWYHLEPSTQPLQLCGRPWVWGSADCWVLVRDWYKQQGVDLPSFSYPPTPEAFEAAPLFDALWQSAGFLQIPAAAMAYGDVVLFNIRGTATNHIGVIVDDGLLLHHARGCLSGREPYTEWHRKCTTGVLRHPDLPR